MVPRWSKRHVHHHHLAHLHPNHQLRHPHRGDHAACDGPSPPPSVWSASSVRLSGRREHCGAPRRPHRTHCARRRRTCRRTRRRGRPGSAPRRLCCSRTHTEQRRWSDERHHYGVRDVLSFIHSFIHFLNLVFSFLLFTSKIRKMN